MGTAKIIVGVIHILLSIAIIALILLQSGKQAGLSGVIGGAADSFFGKNKGRTMDAMLARFTKICAIGFLITSLFLAYGDNIFKQSTTEQTQTETNIDDQSGITDGTDVTENNGETAPEVSAEPEADVEVSPSPEAAGE